jgi:hypothetical protein
VGPQLPGCDVWVKFAAHWCRESGHNVVVFTDLRFENEAAWARKHGVVVHILGRATDTLLANHASEAGVIPAASDLVVINDGSLDSLKAKVERLRNRILLPA